MAVGRGQRREARRPRVAEVFGGDVEPALDLLELLEVAWHDVYGEITPPDDVVDDVLVVSDGDLARLIRAAHTALVDRRDLRLLA